MSGYIPPVGGQGDDQEDVYGEDDDPGAGGGLAQYNLDPATL